MVQPWASHSCPVCLWPARPPPSPVSIRLNIFEPNYVWFRSEPTSDLAWFILTNGSLGGMWGACRCPGKVPLKYARI